MFFSGSLQEGIGSALQTSKAVVCFVHDENETSTLWETIYFQDKTIEEALEQNAITLKLDSKSQEAGFLKAYHSIEEPPIVIVIRNGQLRDSLDRTLSLEVFSHRLLEALGLANTEKEVDNNPEIVSPEPESSNTAANRTIESETAGTSRSENVQAMLSERKAKLEAQKKASDVKQKAEHAAVAKSRREEAEASAPPDSKRANEVKYAQQQRQKQKDARSERERILRLVENDKAERKEREIRRREQAKALREAEDNETKTAQEPNVQTSKRLPGNCAIQIRLLDGTSMKKTFEHSATLSDNVRSWIDSERTEGDTPYTFKPINAPLQNTSIDVSEEGQSLQSIGLTPSATLVLVPVKGYTDAYSSENAGLISRGLSSGYGLVSSGVGLVGSAVGMILGGGVNQNATTASGSNHEATTPVSNVNTLQDHKRDRDRQFYNGNQLNFEPRRDDDSDKD